MHRLVALVTIAACGGTAPLPAVPRAPEPSPSPASASADPVEASPRRAERTRVPMRIRGLRDEIVVTMLDGHPSHPIVDSPDQLERRSDLWDPCVRELVQLRAAAIRDDLGDALTKMTTTCDLDARTITFEPPRYGRAYATGSHVGIAGVLAPATAALVLRVVVRGPAPARLTILANNTRWTSPELEVTHDGVWGRELAAIPLTKTVTRAVYRMLASDGAILRFESENSIEDVLVTEELAADLRTILDVVEDL